MPMKISEERVWAGSETALAAILQAELVADNRLAAHGISREDERETPRILSIDDGVGVISIRGTLNNEADSEWNSWIGATGYPEIRDAVVSAAENPEVKHILLDIDSGGGAVSGMFDTAKLIRTVHSDVKPVFAITDGAMASAAYALGSAAGNITSGKAAVVGSIGVIATHFERSKLLAEAGIGATVIRAGKYKALANSIEPLSKEGAAQIQAIVDASYEVFTEHVAEMRGKSLQYVKSNMADGREFVGQAAMDAGLVDRIGNFDTLMAELKAKSLDAQNNFAQNRGNPSGGNSLRGDINNGDDPMSKRTLSATEAAAIAAGVTLPETKAEIEAPPAVTAAVESEQPAAVESEQPATASNSELLTAQATIQLLTAQLAGKDAALLQANVELNGARSQIESLTASLDPMKGVVAAAVNNMRVSLNLSPVDMKAMSPTQVLAEHTSVVASFSSQYPIGGVSAASPGAKQDAGKPDALAAARQAAVRIK